MGMGKKSNMKRPMSTIELYGVEPEVLAEMKYKDALQVLKKGLLKRNSDLVDELAYCQDYKRSTKIQAAMKKVEKAIAITEIRIEEIR